MISFRLFIADRKRKSHALIVTVAKTDGEAASLHLRFEVEDAEQPHAVRGDSVFVVHDGNATEAQGLDQGLNDFVVRNRPVSLSGRGSWHQGKRFAWNRPAPITDE